MASIKMFYPKPNLKEAASMVKRYRRSHLSPVHYDGQERDLSGLKPYAIFIDGMEFKRQMR
jgi:hypothetical protein